MISIIIISGAALAIICRTIAFLMTNLSFVSYGKTESIFYYVELGYLRSIGKMNSKEEQRAMINKMFNNAVKLMSVSVRPIIIQFLILIFALRCLRTIFNDINLNINIFGWQMTWFGVYFISYLVFSILISNIIAIRYKDARQ
jgi:uncharacterized membrane protein (DUF106 family)